MKPLFLFFLLLNVLVVYAQFDTYQLPDEIKNLKTDSSGTVYVVNNQSVCKYESKTLIESCVYTDEKINQALIRSENEYYLSTDNTLLIYKNQQKTDKIVVDEVITALAQDANNIIIGTLGAGFYSFNLENQNLSQIEEEDFINDILVHKEKIYVLNDNGFKVYNRDFKIVESIDMPKDIPKQIEIFQDGRMVILTNDSKLIFLNDAMSIDKTYQTKAFEIKEISTYKNLLFAIDDKHLKQWTGEDFNLIESGNFDHLLQIKNIVFTSYKKSISQHNLLSRVYDFDKTFSIYADAEKFWLGREGKISLYHKGKIEKEMKFPEAYKNIYVSSLVRHNNKIYAGTMGRGVLIFNAESGKFTGTFQENNTLPSEQNIIQLYQDDNLLWIGYLNSLKAFDIETKTLVHDFTEVLKDNYLYRFHIKDADDFFLCTSDSGLIHVVDGTAKSYLEGNSIYSLANTSSGVVFSAEDNGIYKLNDSLTKLSDRYFFRSNSVYNLLDVEDNLLFVNDFGVDILNPKTNEIAYLSYDNLNEAHLNAYAVGASKVLLGFESGVVELDKTFLEDAYNSKVYLEEPLLFDTPLKQNDQIFDYDQNTWTFSYKTTNYSSSIEQYYKYRLVPIEKNWVSTTQEKITYYNLPPGDYSFEVSSGGHRNFIPTKTEDYHFSISKPIWQNLWFWIVILCITGFLIVIFIRYREREIKKKEALKNIQLEYEYQRLKDQINPHFLFNSFNSIIGIVEESPKKAAKVLEKLSSLFRTILKYEKSEVVSLSKELDFTTQYFEIHQLRFQNLIQLDLEDIADADNKFVIPFSLQLLVENAIKHNIINTKHKLHIRISEEEDYIVVSNNINLKANHKNSLGLGLNNLMKRHDMKLNRRPVIIENKNVYTVKIPYLND